MSAESSAQTTVEFQDLVQRLAEVRTRLIRSFLFLVVASVVAYLFSERALDDMQARMPLGSEMIFLAPSEAFLARIKLALAGGLVLAFPFLMYQLLAFVSPYLSRRDRRIGMFLIPVSFGLFVTGAGFSYAVMLPFALRFLLGFGGAELEPMLSISPFVNFVLFLVLPLGVIFQLPIAMVFLTRVGLVDPAMLSRNRKYAVFAIFVIAAVLTPADVFSQLLMAGPLLVLYEFSLLISRFARRRSVE